MKRPTVAEFIARSIDASGKSQKEIAKACGWPKPNFVSMLKTGESKLPFDKIGPLAEVLGVEPVYLTWLVMQEYMPDTLRSIEHAIRGVWLTDLERNLIEAYRDLTHGLQLDAELKVGSDEARVFRDGTTLIRFIPGKRTKAELATGEGALAELAGA
jgi:transcriptional regulator with XRE-family HTH domain